MIDVTIGSQNSSQLIRIQVDKTKLRNAIDRKPPLKLTFVVPVLAAGRQNVLGSTLYQPKAGCPSAAQWSHSFYFL